MYFTPSNNKVFPEETNVIDILVHGSGITFFPGEKEGMGRCEICIVIMIHIWQERISFSYPIQTQYCAQAKTLMQVVCNQLKSALMVIKFKSGRCPEL